MRNRLWRLEASESLGILRSLGIEGQGSRYSEAPCSGVWPSMSRCAGNAFSRAASRLNRLFHKLFSADSRTLKSIPSSLAPIATRLLLMLFVAGMWSPSWGVDTRLSGAQKQKSALTVGWQTFSISSDERISLYGGRRKQYLGPHWYWGEAGYGAISGKRAGFLEGGIMGGWEANLAQKFVMDASILLGAGGGGAAPQGGGLVVHPTLGIGMKVMDALQVFATFGYIHFVNGNISSASIDFHADLFFWELTY